MNSLSAGAASKRQFPVNVLFMGALAFAICLMPKNVHATLIDFENAVPDGNGWNIPNGYEGFDWSGSEGNNSWVLATPTDGEDLFSVGTGHSGTNYIWSNGGAQLSMSPVSGTFDFTSMWAYEPQWSSQDMTVDGYLAGNLIYSDTVTLGQSYQLYTFDFTDVDTVVFPISGLGTYNLAVDDITVNANSVPDGGTTVTLIGTALVGLAALRRKFARA